MADVEKDKGSRKRKMFRERSGVHDSDEDNDGVYEVEKIVGTCVSNGERLYKVRWTAYGPSHDTWEPYGNLLSCKDIVDDYIAKREQRRKDLNRQNEKGEAGSEIQAASLHTDDPEKTKGTWAYLSSDDEQFDTLKDKFWRDLDQGRVNVFSNDMYSKVKGGRSSRPTSFVDILKSRKRKSAVSTVSANRDDQNKSRRKRSIDRKVHRKTLKSTKTNNEDSSSEICSATFSKTLDAKSTSSQERDTPNLILTENIPEKRSTSTEKATVVSTVDADGTNITKCDSVEEQSGMNTSNRIQTDSDVTDEREGKNKDSFLAKKENTDCSMLAVKEEAEVTDSTARKNDAYPILESGHLNSDSSDFTEVQSAHTQFKVHSVKGEDPGSFHQDIATRHPNVSQDDTCKPGRSLTSPATTELNNTSCQSDVMQESRQTLGDVTDVQPVESPVHYPCSWYDDDNPYNDVDLRKLVRDRGEAADRSAEISSVQNPHSASSNANTDKSKLVTVIQRSEVNASQNTAQSVGNFSEIKNTSQCNDKGMTTCQTELEGHYPQVKLAKTNHERHLSPLVMLQMDNQNALWPPFTSVAGDICVKTSTLIDCDDRVSSHPGQSTDYHPPVSQSLWFNDNPFNDVDMRTLPPPVSLDIMCQSEFITAEPTSQVAPVNNVLYTFDIAEICSEWAKRPCRIKQIPENFEITNAELKQAVREYDYETVNAALNGRKTYDLEQPDERSMTLVMEAAHRGHDDILEFLVLKGADIHATMKNGTTAFMLACEQGHVCTVGLMLMMGAYMNVPNHSGDTALSKAIKRGHKQCVRALLNNGVNFSSPHSTENPMLNLAKVTKNLEILEILKIHISRVKAAFESQVLITLNNTAKIQSTLFPLQCLALREATKFKITFKHELEPTRPGVGMLLFIAHGRVNSDEAKCRFYGPCAVTSAVLNGMKLHPLTEETNFVLSFSPLLNGRNDLEIHTVKVPGSKASLLVCAYRAHLIQQ